MEDFSTMPKMVPQAKSLVAYCDYIGTVIRRALSLHDYEGLLGQVSQMQWDLTPEGALRSTKKLITVQDRAGKTYRITVEEA